MRDLTYNGKRILIAAFLLLDLLLAANFFLRLGLFATGARDAMILGWVATVVFTFYMDPRPDTHTVIPETAGCAMCGRPIADADPVGRLEVRRGRRDYWSAVVHLTCLRRTLRADLASSFVAPRPTSDLPA